MKKLLPLLFVLLLSSCTKSIYHVSSLQSEQVKPVEKDFIFENEHLNVIYNLWEEGGRMRILLFNKTDRPVYIDWTKSVLVRNGVKTLYSQLPPLSKRAYTDTVRYSYQNIAAEPYRLTARANQLTEIPSQTYVAIADFPIQHVIQHINANRKVFNYTKGNSPLRIGQQVAYSFDKTLTDTHLINHSFWVNKIELLRVGELTRLYGPLGKGQPNALYVIEKRPAPGATLAVVGVSIAAVTGAILYYLGQGISLR